MVVADGRGGWGLPTSGPAYAKECIRPKIYRGHDQIGDISAPLLNVPTIHGMSRRTATTAFVGCVILLRDGHMLLIDNNLTTRILWLHERERLDLKGDAPARKANVQKKGEVFSRER
jgi:hypothetical protein